MATLRRTLGPRCRPGRRDGSFLSGLGSGVASRTFCGIGGRRRRRPKPSSELPDKIAHSNSQRVGDDLKGVECHALASILQPVEMNAIQAGEFGKLILRDSFLRAQSPDSFPNCPVDVLQPLRLRVYASRKHPASSLRRSCATKLPTTTSARVSAWVSASFAVRSPYAVRAPMSGGLRRPGEVARQEEERSRSNVP